MTRTKDTTVVSVLHPVCCGLDIHKQFVTACLMTIDSMGKETSLLESFGTFTDDLVRLREWLLEHECPIVALESTGVYWRPVHNLLEGYLNVVLVNARHIKNLPGRKTDMSDCQWIATLLRVGFLKASFIPPKIVRHWRELTRYRRSLVEALGDVKRQVHKLLESSNIKIDSVVSDLFGKTGRNLMDLLLKDHGELTLQAVHTCLRGRLKPKATELFRAVQGFFDDHHRWMLRQMLESVDQQEANLAKVESRLRNLLQPHDELIDRITQIPGIGATSAYAILSETGSTLESFPNAGALCSWAGVCPANNESAGKRRSTRSPVRRSHLRTHLVEAAWGAVKKKSSYLRSKYFSLKSRLGPKKAIMAIAHRILKALYYIIKQGDSFRDLGENYLIELRRRSITSYLARQAKKLGMVMVSESTWNQMIDRSPA
jgi:transposase